VKDQGPKTLVEYLIVGGCAVFFIIPAMLVGIFLGAFVNAYVLTCLWDWFIVTTFDMTSISLAEAYGISLFFSYLQYRTHHLPKDVILRPKNDDEEDDDIKNRVVYHLKSSVDVMKWGSFWKILLTWVVAPGFVLLVGKVVHTYWIIPGL
jgi:hypothetical protein